MRKKYNRNQKESDFTRVVRLILTGVSIALLYHWVTSGGYYDYTMEQIVTTIFIIGITAGIWIHKILD